MKEHTGITPVYFTFQYPPLSGPMRVRRPLSGHFLAAFWPLSVHSSGYQHRACVFKMQFLALLKAIPNSAL